MHPRNNFPLPQLMVILLLLLQACGPDTSSTRPDETQTPPDQQALSLFNNGEFAAAAEEFLSLSKSAEREQAIDYQLYAAESLLEISQLDRVNSLLSGLSIPRDKPAYSWQQLLLARLLLQENRPTVVMNALNLVHVESLPGRLQVSLFRTQAAAYARLGNAIENARARIRLASLLLDEGQQQENRLAIWEGLNSLRAEILQQLLPPDVDELRGWMELALLAKLQINDAGNFSIKLSQWQESYPNHPGNLEILTELAKNSQLLDIAPSQIAVLLPFSGRYASAANAIRDGLVTAWYAALENRPELRFYDANAANISSVYEQAINGGADFIVGPLEKDAVSVLQEKGKLPAITLALNQSNDVSAPASDTGLYQFGLSPESEARQIAERAWFDGHLSALVITPEGAWGDRIYTAFQERWLELGGRISKQRQYPNNTQDFSTPIQQLLNIESSEQRAKKLRQITGTKLSFEPRIRQDVDFIFVAAYPQAGRQIRPQLLFHNAAQLPVYATSHVFSGVVDAARDHDLDGILFADMPWLLDTTVQHSELYLTIARNWSQSETSARLYALGVDAYQVIPQLGKLLLQPFRRYRGVTGTLSMDQSGLMQRQLEWAVFKHGIPQQENAVRVVDQ